jgi:type IV pilus assembly protein PilY1
MNPFSSIKRQLAAAGSSAALVMLGGYAAAADTTLALTDVPLFLSQRAEPNVMLMFDNSGSMSNIVPEAPYSPSLPIANCPAGNTIPAGSEIDLDVFFTLVPQIVIVPPNTDNATYPFLQRHNFGARCFDNGASYIAHLADAVGRPGYLPSEYTGHYLNWYFDTATDPSGCTNSWSSGTLRFKPCTKSRLTIAKSAGVNLVTNILEPGFRVGLSTYNGADGGALREIVSSLDSAKRLELATEINKITANGSTPLAETLSDIGRYFASGATQNLVLHPGAPNEDRTKTAAEVFNNHSFNNLTGLGTIPNPIEFSCQKNFAILVTDGRPSEDRAVDPDIADYLGECSSAISPRRCDATPNTVGIPRGPLATIAFQNGTQIGRLYENQGSDFLDDVAGALNDIDLRPGLLNPDGRDPKNSVSTFVIGFADDQVQNDPLLLSTARAGGGEFFAAGNEDALNAAFRSSLGSILEKSSSASSASVNSGTIGDGTRIYQSRFNSGTWTGQLLAFGLATDPAARRIGALSPTPLWDASAQDVLPAPGDRQIITRNSDGQAVPFLESALDSTRIFQLQGGSPTSPPASPRLAGELVNYLRGGEALEGIGAGKLRVRRDSVDANKLGDIVGSAPLFVGRPRFRYPDSLESARYSDFATRTPAPSPIVFAGANDGMLHGFNADTGAEVFAYIPGAVFPNLKLLAEPTYQHSYYVDGSPTYGDVFYDAAWHTVLVGGLNKGGQGVYALDITNTAKLAAAQSTTSGNNPADIALWEFTDAQDTAETNKYDLGFTFSQPVVVRVRAGSGTAGRWVAIFGNGYNSRFNDGRASTTGNAVLYIVDIKTGSLLKKIDTGVGTTEGVALGLNYDNGLSTPIVVDLTRDTTADYVYAGDLYGNVWKFDLTSANSAAWDVAYSGPGGKAPLFRARDENNKPQPITTRPEVIRHPNGSGMVVLVGTGKYLEEADKLITPTLPQTFYGIHDRNSGTSSDIVADRTVLTRQTILDELDAPFDPDGTGPLTTTRVRVTTDRPFDSTRRGWYLDLVSPSGYQAEKQVTNPVVRGGNVVFTTLIPEASPCSSGGTGWIMELDAASGSRLERSPVDLNGDLISDNRDFVEVVVGGKTIRVPISGVGSTESILQAPGIVEGRTEQATTNQCIQFRYLPGSSGNIQKIVATCKPSDFGRQSWRQIR